MEGRHCKLKTSQNKSKVLRIRFVDKDQVRTNLSLHLAIQIVYF